MTQLNWIKHFITNSTISHSRVYIYIYTYVHTYVRTYIRTHARTHTHILFSVHTLYEYQRSKELWLKKYWRSAVFIYLIVVPHDYIPINKKSYQQ